MHAARPLTALLVSFLFSSTASAQVFDSGPSDPALFTNVFNLPEDVLPNVSIVGGVAGETTQVNIPIGGSVGFSFIASSGAEVNISGGSMGRGFRPSDGSNVNLFGSDFVLDGVLLDDLILGEAFTILDRDVTLSGLLADGSAFSFQLNSEFSQDLDLFPSGTTLTRGSAMLNRFILASVFLSFFCFAQLAQAQVVRIQNEDPCLLVN